MKVFSVTAVTLLTLLPTFLWAQAGCGTDCGNVGDAYERHGPPPNQKPISSCAKITTGGNFIVTKDIGSDATSTCLQVYWPPAMVNIDLGGHTVTGRVVLGSNHSPNVIFHGTITCNAPYSSGACLTWGTGRIHHITIENQNPSPLANINTPGTTSAANTTPLLRIDHVTSTVVAAPGSKRTRNFMDDGASGSNPAVVSLPVEVDHNLITCSDNASACQGVELWDAPNSYVHNNLIILPANCSPCEDSARGIIFDVGSNNGVAAYNVIVTLANRAVRVRNAKHISIHDNQFSDITQGGRLAAVHLGETNFGVDDEFVNVFNNAFELGPGGNGVVSSAATDVNVYNNTVTCLNRDCSAVGFFALTDVPDQVAADQIGTSITLGNNEVSPLTDAGKPAVKVCGPAGNPAYLCAGSKVATSTAIVCSSGDAVGNRTINQVLPPCP